MGRSLARLTSKFDTPGLEAAFLGRARERVFEEVSSAIAEHGFSDFDSLVLLVQMAAIRGAVRESEGNMSLAAMVLGMKRSRLVGMGQRHVRALV